MTTSVTPSLVNHVRSRYLDAIVSIQGTSGPWRILVLDEQVKEHMNSVLKMYDILEHRIAQIEMIETNRAHSPSLEAIYILSPSSRNIDRIINDFASSSSAAPPPSSKKDKKSKTPQPTASQGPRYAAAHVYFVDTLPDPLLGKLGNSPANNYLQTLKELYVNYWPLEAQAFSLKLPHTFFTLFTPPTPENQPQRTVPIWERELGFACQSIVNVLISLDEFPEIRYYSPNSLPTPLGPGLHVKQHATRYLAFKVQEALENYARQNTGWPRENDSHRPRGILFITDRTMDIVAPLLHEFTYQAMCNDLLPIENGRSYKYSFKNGQGMMEDTEAILSDDDKVWVEVRHMHMKDALDKLIAAFNEHKNSTGKGGTGINDLKDMLASLPGLRESKEMLSLHLNMAEKSMGIFEKKRLNDVGNVEQCCATGQTASGKTPRTLVEEMVPLLDDRTIASSDKLRIIALYIMYRDGVPEEDRKRLYQHARLLLHEQDAVNNLSLIGQTVTKDTSKKVKPLFKQPYMEDAYDISRYQPLIKLMLQDHFAGKLDQNSFPYVRPPPPSASQGGASPSPPPTSLRSARPRWQTGQRSRSHIEPRQRCFVFNLGGMTYSEIRSVYEISTSSPKDVYIGSTDVMRPIDFIENMARLDRHVIQDEPPPSAAKESSTNHSIPQPHSSSGSSIPPPPPSSSTNSSHSPVPSPQKQQQQHQPSRLQRPPPPSTTSSYSSSNPPEKEEKKKKRGLFKRF